MINSIKNHQIQAILKALLLPEGGENFQSSQREKNLLDIYKRENKAEKEVSKLE